MFCAAISSSAVLSFLISSGSLPYFSSDAFCRLYPFAIAGGLTPETVVEAASVSGACAVDVSSGVESAPGVKDAEKIRRLLATADALPSRGFWLGG
ncbi:MAG: hypothetical protein II857_12465 [Selenomonadaceae bacterium]|nr:hypothetical protein [Selenomonadaceae bacterium]